MQAEEPVARRAEKLLAATSIKLRLALASGLILVVGALIAPPAAPTGLSTPQERVAPLLEEQVQLREVPLPFRGVQPVAARVREQVVGIPPAERRLPPTRNDFANPSHPSRAAGFGVFVSDIHVLTHALALDGRSSVQISLSDGEVLGAQVAAYESSTGLVLLQTAPSGKSAATQAGESPAAGELAVAVGRWNQADIAVPVFVTNVGSGPLLIDATAGSVLPGMPLYNLDSELIAIAAGTEAGAAFPVREAAKRLTSRAAIGQPQASVGIAFQDLTAPLSRAFGAKGVLISEVVDGGPADVAGVQAGDVLVAIGDMEVESAETAARALSQLRVPMTTSVRVLRGGGSRAIELTAAPTYDVAALARKRVDETAPGPEARVLFAAQILEGAGIPPTARVLAVNGRAVSSRAQAERELRNSRRPVTVLLRQAGTQFFAAIEPAR